MRLLKTALLLSLLLIGVVAISCGGGEEKSNTPVATAAQRTPTVTSAVASPTAAAAPTRTTPAGSTLETAMEYFPYELENIRYGGNIHINVQNMPPHFDPKLNNQAITRTMRWVYEKVAGWVPNEGDLLNTMGPILAESWSVSPDLKAYTFKLRPGVKWQNIAPVNGRDLVADDVVFSLNRYREKDSLYISTYAQVDTIEAADKSTVVIRLKDPSAWVLNDLFPTAEYIIAPEAVAEGKGTIPYTLGIGTGPYIVKSYRFNSGGTLVRNPDYWGRDKKGNPLPYTDSIEIRYTSDVATTVAAYRTGQIDAGQSPGVSDIINMLKTNPDLRVFKSNIVRPATGFTFNTQKAPWNDVRVRRAFNMALDKDRYANQVSTTPNWSYGSTVLWSLVSDEPFTVDKLGPYYKFNPAEAKKLLIEAGFKDGKVKINTPLTFSHPTMTLRATAYQAFYKEQGIEFELDPRDFSTYAPYYYQRAFADIAITFLNGDDLTLNWVAQNKFQRDSTQTTAKINDPEIEALVKEIKVTSDPAKLRQQAKFLYDYDTLGSYYIWTPSEQGYAVTQARVRNWGLRSNDGFFSQRYTPWLADAPRTSP